MIRRLKHNLLMSWEGYKSRRARKKRRKEVMELMKIKRAAENYYSYRRKQS